MVFHRQEIIEFQDGHKELIYVDNQTGKTFMRDATPADLEWWGHVNKPTPRCPYVDRLFGDMLK
jgi:hypothetical protein